MGRHSHSVKKNEIKPMRPHPVWRGIGCVIMIIIPIMSYVGAILTIEALVSRNLVPYQLLGTPSVPAWLWNVPVLAGIVQGIIGQKNLYAILLSTLLYIFILSGLFSFFNALIYRMIAPSRFGPTDAPPPKVKPKKYTR